MKGSSAGDLSAHAKNLDYNPRDRLYHGPSNAASCGGGNFKSKLWNRSMECAAIFVFDKEGAKDLAGIVNEVVAVVGKGCARVNDWSLPHDTFSLHDVADTVPCLTNDPFAPPHYNRVFSLVVNGDEVDKGVRMA